MADFPAGFRLPPAGVGVHCLALCALGWGAAQTTDFIFLIYVIQRGP